MEIDNLRDDHAVMTLKADAVRTEFRRKDTAASNIRTINKSNQYGN